MNFQKDIWYIFIFAAFTMSLVYYVAFDRNITTFASSGTSLLSKIMGQNSQGNFQKPF